MNWTNCQWKDSMKWMKWLTTNDDVSQQLLPWPGPGADCYFLDHVTRERESLAVVGIAREWQKKTCASVHMIWENHGKSWTFWIDQELLRYDSSTLSLLKLIPPWIVTFWSRFCVLLSCCMPFLFSKYFPMIKVEPADLQTTKPHHRHFFIHILFLVEVPIMFSRGSKRFASLVETVLLSHLIIRAFPAHEVWWVGDG